ncbi:hypothetical protein L9W92_10895 [Pelotomaculum terephthalicicum JT]|uniref:hypothetical protein n=1 Tax=Pelotomaculum TaxID=191373 RepID=UPI0009D1F335|nr:MULTISPECIES: hypothetical protein [Pelotomaculum]MCG9968560.1 hypothetical protein [Pelotomaculum terephthalicicum JT]OPX87422.1 MAG: hypothetical protein A4E54_01704 [Pelotomaculum sp. PtaB.Bin117]OPY61076.1 MAG: hypothetical protein A4E56_02278 [Pelotomaculum sp. PtaU1.Bin065]
MDKMPLIAVLFQSVPEEIIVYSFGMAVVGEYINIKKITIAALITAFAMMFVRWFIPYFGLHSIVGMLILFILFWRYLGLEAWKAIISSLLSLTALILLDDFILQAILNLKHITLTEGFQNNFIRITYTYPHLVVFGLITWIIYYKKWFLIKGSRVSNIEYTKEKMKEPLILTTIVLSQGIILVILNMYFGYINKYSLITKLLSLIYFSLSIIFLKYFWSLKDEVDELTRNTEMY